MPCDNITELIRVVLDEKEQLTDYRFIKRTCGAGVGGESLLIDRFRGLAVSEIIKLNIDTFCQLYQAEKDWQQFLYLKHFIALRGVLQVYTGNEAGGIGDFCTISGIGHENGEVIIDSEIAVDAVTEKIKACGRCGGCESKQATNIKHKRKPLHKP
ncbi:MAG: hypothetical protein KAR42_07790 [candidate division Zixibacteria bacterium]|nr:hypothetical protein [candidate division Zixibacteria bacterium]